MPPSSRRLQREVSTDLNEIIGDHPDTPPAPHPRKATIATPVQSVAALEHADTTFRSGPPSLAGSEPPLLLQPASLFVVRAAIGHRYPTHAHFLHLLFILSGVEARVGGHQPWPAPKP